MSAERWAPTKPDILAGSTSKNLNAPEGAWAGEQLDRMLKALVNGSLFIIIVIGTLRLNQAVTPLAWQHSS